MFCFAFIITHPKMFYKTPKTIDKMAKIFDEIEKIWPKKNRQNHQNYDKVRRSPNFFQQIVPKFGSLGIIIATELDSAEFQKYCFV